VCMCVETGRKVRDTNIGSTGESAKRGMVYCEQVTFGGSGFS
jgi:hypothetical protein